MYNHGGSSLEPTESGWPFRRDPQMTSRSVHVAQRLRDCKLRSSLAQRDSPVVSEWQGSPVCPARQSTPSKTTHGSSNSTIVPKVPNRSSQEVNSTASSPDAALPSSAVSCLQDVAPSMARTRLPAKGAGRRGKDVHTAGDPNKSQCRTDWIQANPPCGDHDLKGSPRMEEGKKRAYARAEKVGMLQDGRPNHPRAADEAPPAIVRAEGCEYAGCDRTPKYGQKDKRLSVCEVHKRKGMYTVRDGVLIMATWDGTAFRETRHTPPVKDDRDAVIADATSGPEPIMMSIKALRAAARPLVAATTPASAPRQRTKSAPVKNRVVSRKKCEVPGCNTQPSYGPAGSGQVRFCSRHKEKTHVSLKNRPCLFPGCNTRPHYGLSGGRAVFCVTHKKDNMVHVLKDLSKAWKKGKVDRNNREHGQSGKSSRTTKNLALSEPKECERARVDRRKREAKEGVSGTKGKRRRMTTVGVLPQDAGSSPQPHTTKDSRSAPSDGMRSMREAGESAQEVAAVSTPGRRVRTPSRKLLEACGRTGGESAQWMTKEKKEEEARIRKERKEQRMAAAAGLRVGQVKEISAADSAQARNVRNEASVGGGASNDGETDRWNSFHRKPTRDESPCKASKRSDVGRTGPDTLGGSATTTDAEGAAAVAEQEQNPSASARAAVEEENISCSSDKKEAPAWEPSVRRASRAQHIVGESYPKPTRAAHDNEPNERDDCPAQATCEFENCARRATFGVSVVRYWIIA